MTVPEPKTAAPRASFAQAAVAGATWGWLGAGAVGTAEWLLVAVRSAAYGWGGSLPPALVAASLGEMIVSQGVVWVPLAIVATGLRGGGAPFAAGFTVLGAGLSTIVAHGFFEAHLGRLEVIATLLITAAATAGFARVAARTPRPRVAGAASAGLALLAVVAFVRSPLFDPGAIDAPAPAASPAPSPARPHVLWIVLDTARADRTSLHGAERDTTPFLARFGDTAHVFDGAVADGTWTSPSHASMFTGLPVRAHGMGRNAAQLSPRFRTVAEELADAGYETASFSNNPLIGSGSGLARGFQTKRIPSRLAALGMSSAEIWLQRFGVRPPLPWWNRDLGAATTNDLAAAWLDGRADPARPLFLFVNYMEAHLPWDIPERFRTSFLEGDRAARSRALRHRAFGDLEKALNQRVAREGTGFLSDADREVLRDLYDGTLRYVDARVEELLGELAARGLLEHTLVVVTSDHGEYLGEHDLWSHLYRTYQDLTHVVLAVRPPGAGAGRRSDALVQLSDLHATVLLHTLGAESGADPTRDLLAPGGSAAAAGRVAISEAGAIGARSGTAGNAFRNVDTPRGRRLAQPEVAIQDGRFKLVRPEKGAAELYDLTRDPGETRDVLGRHGPAARRLDAALRRFERNTPEYTPSIQDLQPDPDVQRALRELGYLE